MASWRGGATECLTQQEEQTTELSVVTRTDDEVLSLCFLFCYDFCGGNIFEFCFSESHDRLISNQPTKECFYSIQIFQESLLPGMEKEETESRKRSKTLCESTCFCSVGNGRKPRLHM